MYRPLKCLLLIYATTRLPFCSRIKYNVGASRYFDMHSSNLSHSVADPGATLTFVAGGALKPIGGHILSHASATRLFLRKGW